MLKIDDLDINITVTRLQLYSTQELRYIALYRAIRSQRKALHIVIEQNKRIHYLVQSFHLKHTSNNLSNLQALTVKTMNHYIAFTLLHNARSHRYNTGRLVNISMCVFLHTLKQIRNWPLFIPGLNEIKEWVTIFYWFLITQFTQKSCTRSSRTESADHSRWIV